MDEDTPPPLPPKQYKLRQSQLLSNNTNPFLSQKSLLHFENNFTDSFEPDVPKRSAINDLATLDLSSGSERKDNSGSIQVRSKSTIRRQNAIKSKNPFLDRSTLPRRRNDLNPEPIFIDDLITKNFSEFQIKLRKENDKEFGVGLCRSQIDDSEQKAFCLVKEDTIPKNEVNFNFETKLSGNVPNNPFLSEDLFMRNEKLTCISPVPFLLKSQTLPISDSSNVSKPQSFTLPPYLQDDDRTKSEIFGSLFNKVVETNDDIIDFGRAITELRRSYPFHDPQTNCGMISSIIIKNVLSKTSVDVLIYFKSDYEKKGTLNCEYSWTASEITSQALTMFSSGSLDLFLIIHQYIFKFVGFDLYLEDDIRLCDHAHVQDLVKQGKTVMLDLIKKEKICKNLSRDHKDDLMLENHFVTFEDSFEKPDSISVSEQGLKVLLESFDAEIEKLINNVDNCKESNFMPERMIQVVKAISTVLANIDIPQIQNSIELIKSLKPLSDEEFTLVNRDGTYQPEPPPSPTFDREVFDLALRQLTSGIYYLVDLYCKSFELNFNPEAKDLLTKFYDKDDVYQQVDRISSDDFLERVDPRSINDKFNVKIQSIHRIPSEWKYSFINFRLEVGLYYGGELLCAVKKCTKSSVDKGFFEHIRFAQLLEFDLSVREIPRETKIAFVLHGIVPSLHSTSLCWFTSNLYNYEGFLITGSHLFGLLYDVEFDPVATCTTNYIHCDTVILKADFQIYPIEVMFPQPLLHITETARKNQLNDYDLSHVQKILRKDPMFLSDREKSLIWNHRFAVSDHPKALVYVLLSVPSWDAESILLVHNALNYWKKLHPHNALKLLEGKFPDKIIREYAISCISCVSDHELFDYLPGLVQALKYEAYHNSSLARFLIKQGLSSVRFCNRLYWYLKYYVEDAQFCQRYKTVLSGLLHVCGRRLRVEFTKQDRLIKALTKVTNLIKETKDSLRRTVLVEELEKLNNDLDSSFRIPYDPAIKVSRIIPEDSSYFNSYTVPLRIAFKNNDPLGEDVHMIFKIGDDLRKDLLTLQMFHIMNNLWFTNGLDMKIMLYNVLPTGPSAGLIQIVPNSSTLREIHVQFGGVTGSFKDDSLALWLQQFNPTKATYHKAIDNFTASAAGYCVATYILGIGDRHNDNIMITRNGHLFHIDFSKFMGDIQKFGNIKRDRVPFVLTPDMAYVINNGVTPSHNFQKFTEYCCTAFNIIRQNRSKLLNVLRLMMHADISFASPEADIKYVYHALQLQLSDEEAELFFSQLIQNSLSSVSTQLNFFIHNVAHIKDTLDGDTKKFKSITGFSFSNQVHSFDSKQGVESARVVDFQKRYIPTKHYVFVINVLHSSDKAPKFVFRSYDDFQELHENLSRHFSITTGIEIPELPSRIVIGRSQIREVAQERRFVLDQYLVSLSKLPLVWASKIMATFLHCYIKDTEEEQRFLDSVHYLQEGWKSRIGGKVKMSIVYEKQYLKIIITHVSNLVPRKIQGLADSYVKSFLLPDFMKYTKRKSRICRKSLNPTFNETFMYNTPLELLKNRVLQISVWDQVNITDTEFLGGFHYYLSEFDPKVTTSCWFNLVDIDLNY